MTSKKFEAGIEYVLCGTCESKEARLTPTGQAAAFAEGPCALCGRDMAEVGGGGYYILQEKEEIAPPKLLSTLEA